MTEATQEQQTLSHEYLENPTLALHADIADIIESGYMAGRHAFNMDFLTLLNKTMIPPSSTILHERGLLSYAEYKFYRLSPINKETLAGVFAASFRDSYFLEVAKFFKIPLGSKKLLALYGGTLELE